ncbi:MAG: tetratricopeptide repeat protein [Acidimicrobiales bacterium]
MSELGLAEELDYLTCSIEDLEREHAAGDVSDSDYRRLSERYRQRADQVERALRVAGRPALAPPVAARSRRARLRTTRARLVTGWGALGCFGIAAVLLAMSLAGVGPFAGTPLLPVRARVQIMLAEASVLGSRGEISQALSTYDRVLALRPEQPVALADGGWLARFAGLTRHNPVLVRNGDAEIEAAVRADPGYAVARAYDGVLLYIDRREPRLAVAEFGSMLDDEPSATLLWSVRPEALAAYRAAGAVPPGPIQNARRPATAGAGS